MLSRKNNSQTTSARPGFIFGEIALMLIIAVVLVSSINQNNTVSANTQTGTGTVEISVQNEDGNGGGNENGGGEDGNGGNQGNEDGSQAPQVPDTGIFGRLHLSYGEGAKAGITIMLLTVGLLGAVYLKYRRKGKRAFKKPVPSSDIKFQ